MPTASLPAETLRLFEAAERTAVEHIRAGRYEKAETIYASQLAILRDLQSRTRKRFHKGGPLYNLGIVMLLQRRFVDGTRSVASALVEDVLSEELVSAWRQAPAYHVLAEVMRLPSGVLNRIEEEASRLRLTRRIPKAPELFLDRIEFDSLLPPELVGPPVQQTEMLLRLPPPKPAGILVFVGGSFKMVAVLRLFQKIVLDCGHVPILLDYEFPQWVDTFTACTAAMDNCDLSVFEVSIPEGQMAEIVHHYEKWKQASRGIQNPQILLLMQELFGTKSPRVPPMIPPEYKTRCKRYRELPAAEELLKKFLP